MNEPQKIPLTAELWHALGPFDGDCRYVPIPVSYDEEIVYVERPDEENECLAIELLSLIRAIGESGLSNRRYGTRDDSTSWDRMSVTVGKLSFEDVEYDARSDVLYLSIGKPRAADDSRGTPEGHAVRYGPDGEIIGVTLINAKPPDRAGR